MQSLQRFFSGLSASDKLNIAIPVALFVLGLPVALIVAFLSFIGNVYTPVVQEKWNIKEAQSKENKIEVKRITESDKISVTKALEQGTKSHDIAIKDTSVLKQPVLDEPKTEIDKPEGILNPIKFINTGDLKSPPNAEALNIQPNNSILGKVHQISNRDFEGLWEGTISSEKGTFSFEIFITVEGSNVIGYSKISDDSGNYGIRDIDSNSSSITGDRIDIQEEKQLREGVHPLGGYWTSKYINLSLKEINGQLRLFGTSIHRKKGVRWDFTLSKM